MKAIVLAIFDGADCFELHDMVVPQVDVGVLLVRLIATSVNPRNRQIRCGNCPEYFLFAAITDHDISGAVENLGPRVQAQAKLPQRASVHSRLYGDRRLCHQPQIRFKASARSSWKSRGSRTPAFSRA